MQQELFNQEALEHFNSPDDLTKTIKMTSPGVWMTAVACLLFMLGVFAWGVFGVVSAFIETTGMERDGKVICFVSIEDVSRIEMGNEASAGEMLLKISEISFLPLSKKEASAMIEGDYFVNMMVTEEWVYAVTFDIVKGDPLLYADRPFSIKVTTERTSPLGLIFER